MNVTQDNTYKRDQGLPCISLHHPSKRERWPWHSQSQLFSASINVNSPTSPRVLRLQLPHPLSKPLCRVNHLDSASLSLKPLAAVGPVIPKLNVNAKGPNTPERDFLAAAMQFMHHQTSDSESKVPKLILE